MKSSPLALTLALLLLLVSGCEAEPGFPEPDAWGELAGPGGPSISWEPDQLWTGCAHLDGGEDDSDHHNFVTMYDGYLLMPWAPEWSQGGLSFFEFDDPCSPLKVGEAFDPGLRESHNTSFSRRGDRVFAALDYHGGLVDETIVGGAQIWDITDPADPFRVADIPLPGYLYPDAYARVSLSVFWQGGWLFVSGADNGFWVVDASDPLEPVFMAQYTFNPPLRVGAVHAIGDVALVSTAEGSRTVLLDISDPTDPQPIPGGEFHVLDADGVEREYYFANTGGRYALFARKEAGGGFMAYDLSDPSAPTKVGDAHSPDGNGGYVFRQHDTVFVGESNFAAVYDITDLEQVVELGRAHLVGDLDTATPIGNVFVLAVDDDAVPDQASLVVPWRSEPDRRPPSLELHRPVDGATFVAPSARIGLSFDEMVEFKSVFEGSLRVATSDGAPVEGFFAASENLVSFQPTEPLAPDTSYVVTVPAGGITDFNGNAVDREWSFQFSTGAELSVP